MARTDNFRKQHAEILSIARDINQQLGSELTSQTITSIRRQLGKLYRLVGLHLAVEDQSLYPAMLRSTDVEVRSLAQQYSDEMGGLASAFHRHMTVWESKAAISTAPAAFAAQTTDILHALAIRIRRENAQLYPVADTIRQPSRQMLSNESVKASNLAMAGKVKKRDLASTLRPYITS